MAFVVIAVAATASLVAPPNSAQATPPSPASLNGAAYLALNVPGSLLSGASPATISGASLAVGQAFDWTYAATTYAAVSGTFTPTPVNPGVVLSPAEEAAWNEIVSGFRGAPATRATTLLKGAGAVGVAIGGFSVGLQVGFGALEIFGVNADGMACAATGEGGRLALTLLSAADCSGWEGIPEGFIANEDATGGSWAQFCNTSGTYCLKLLGSAAGFWRASAIWSSNRFWCFDRTVGSGALPSGDSLRVEMPSIASSLVNIPQSMPAGSGFASWSVDVYTSGSDLVNPYVSSQWTPSSVICAAGTDVVVQTRYAGYPYAYEIVPPVQDPLQMGYRTGSSGATVWATPLTGNPLRLLRCIVTWTGGTASADSATFRESEGALPNPVCPPVPEDSAFESLEIREVNLEDNSWSVVYLQDATDEYSAWWSAYPECVNGSCLLDLQQSSLSCFSSGVNCQGWFEDPGRAATYTCRYGTHSVDLSECFVYSPSFEGDDGHGYGDPVDGSAVASPTSPTRVDLLTKSLLERGWLKYGPTAQGFQFATADEYQAARTVAQQCVDLEAEDECEKRPIFAPGDNVKEAAQHDLDAIVGHPSWVGLNRANPPLVASGWYIQVPNTPCSVPYDPDYSQCDEFPYRSSQQAGSLSGTQASLRPIDKSDNENEGVYLNLFYSQCSVGNGDPYLVIPWPTPTLTRVTTTEAWC